MKPIEIAYSSIPSPLGQLWAAVSAFGLWALDYGRPEAEFLAIVRRRGPVVLTKDPATVQPALLQGFEYLQGRRRTFDLPIDWSGMTPFQVDVRRAVMGVPYGHTATYGEIARQVCTIRASRAVGQANATNPMLFVIPCHRIIGSTGSLTGFGGKGGIKTKARLLQMEGASLPA
ncbi:MAG: methylated-DNA--[protein]-cysteine S-methyltransferase [Anaerolineae bacterium]|nr:MAG: methylated-DNA--[protein]-cysteine S-methyltransferase [Anaerolineae bacterium]